MLLTVIPLTTQALLAWVIVAIGVLGFIVAHTIQKWYKAILPALLALAVIAFGLYCVIEIAHKAKPASTNGSEEARDLSGEEISGLGEEAQPSTRENLAEDLTAYVPDLPGNPFHLREQKSLKVTVRIQNHGRKAVTEVTVSCFLPLRSDPRRGRRSSPHTFTLDEPLKANAETDVVVTVEGVEKLEDYSRPRVRIDEAH
jgi:hypothetical protein